MDRREMMTGTLVAGLAMALPQAASAQAPFNASGETLTLWPGVPPGGAGLNLPAARIVDRIPPLLPTDRSVDQVGVPTLSVFRPARPDGSALVIAAGGGYLREVMDFEGSDIARRFNAAGVTCFVLCHRLPGEGWTGRSDVPLQDAQRAMRLVRANAARFGIDPARIGFMGFSAGGHVAASIATRFTAPVYAPIDDADRADARPNFSVPMYPVITMGAGAHSGSRDNLLGPDPSPQAIGTYSCERHIPADTPPTFIALAADDPVVAPLPNGLAYFTALRGANIPAQIHVFEVGGHGFGIAKTVGKPLAAWPDMVLTWGASHGFFGGA